MVLHLAKSVILKLQAEAELSAPYECCGLLLGDGRTIIEARPTANIHPEPARHFEIDPQALVNAHRDARSGGPQVMGYYHSHPNRQAEPSETDREQSAQDGSVWAIIAAGRVSFWRDCEDGFAPLSYSLTDG